MSVFENIECMRGVEQQNSDLKDRGGERDSPGRLCLLRIWDSGQCDHPSTVNGIHIFSSFFLFCCHVAEQKSIQTRMV